MNRLDKLIAWASPARAAARARDRQILAHYDAATVSRRSSSWTASQTDADGAARKRGRMAFISRDMVRNTPFALRAQQVITGHVVGDGITPKIAFEKPDDASRKAATRFIETHLECTSIDVDGRQNLYGQQKLVQNTMVDAGEALVLRRWRAAYRPGQLPFQLQVLEPDFLDETRDGPLPEGGYIHQGIEYDVTGTRVAYHLFQDHPGASLFRHGWSPAKSVRVPAWDVLHIYRQDRPGQMRGVTWFAPVAMALQDLGDYQDAQIMRQKIAACFTAFRRLPTDGKPDAIPSKMQPGAIFDLKSDEDISFAKPPEVGGYDEFTSSVLRSVAAGLGISFEALTTNLSKVNYSSMRAGRLEMDRNVSTWQWVTLIPMMMQPLGDWIKEGWALMEPTNARRIRAARIDWTPPHKMLVNPAQEIPALINEVRAGFRSRSDVIRTYGFDPERITAEILEERKFETENGLVFDTNAAVTSGSGVTQARPEGVEFLEN